MTWNKMIWLGSGKYQESKTGKKQKRRLKTLWSIALLEKLTFPQTAKKFPVFYGTQTLITAFTEVHQLSLY